ncbi:MAG: hypothetical protein GY711_02115, partial [bacterium]|nr:hypothetical protein [bacterium]
MEFLFALAIGSFILFSKYKKYARRVDSVSRWGGRAVGAARRRRREQARAVNERLAARTQDSQKPVPGEDFPEPIEIWEPPPPPLEAPIAVAPKPEP